MDGEHGPVSPAARAPLPADDLPPERSSTSIWRGIRWAMILAIVVLAVASWVALGTEPAPAVDRSGRPSAPAPTSAIDPTGRVVPTVAFETFDGRPATLDELRGKPTVLNFWGSQCAPCITEMPDLERVHQRYGDRLHVVGVTVFDNDAAARKMAADTGVTYTLGHDRKGAVANAFGVINLPSTALLASDGTVVWITRSARAMTEDELTMLIDEKLGL